MIFVFKTAVKTKKQLKQLQPHIDNALPKAKWNFDLHDIDNIFRVDSEENIILTVIDLFRMHGFPCEELL
jgi:hypothetical protein